MAEREVRYCTTDDGIRIAFCVEGEGPPLLWCPIFVESFSIGERHPGYADLLGKLRRRWTVVQYDARGTGLSRRDVTDFSGPALVADVKAVVQASGYQNLSIWGNSSSGARAIAFSAANPESVSHLVLYDAYHLPREAWPLEQIRAIGELCRSNWKIGAEVISGMGLRPGTPEETLRQYSEDPMVVLSEIYQQSADGRVAAGHVLAAESWDVSDLLPDLRMPVLVVHHLHNPIIPMDVAETMAATIPGARLVTIDEPGGSSIAFGTRERLPTAIVDFLPKREQDRPSAARGPFRTILFTDLVGPHGDDVAAGGRAGPRRCCASMSASRERC